MYMQEISESEVNKYISGNYKNVPKCQVCLQKICYINVVWEKKGKIEKSHYHYSKICNSCLLPRKYISDNTYNSFVISDCKMGPKCNICKKKICFLKIDMIGKYFSEICASCLRRKKFV